MLFVTFVTNKPTDNLEKKASSKYILIACADGTSYGLVYGWNMDAKAQQTSQLCLLHSGLGIRVRVSKATTTVR